MKHSRQQVIFLVLASTCCYAYVLKKWSRAEPKIVSERSAPGGRPPSTRTSPPAKGCKDALGGFHKEGENCLMVAFGDTSKPYRCLVGVCRNGECVYKYMSECSTS
ncbi:uncharacterized protein LOC142803271 [Rhipicephalus microplus]|uniref:uncharacterized protein LOC142803271 n=1 Tax=Rhipicephalus microplus TaxID=6941 RepID=UPI003F6D2327